MTMHKVHNLHWHGPDWHAWETRLSHLVHDPRFWATVVIVGGALLMLIFGLFLAPGQAARPVPQGYPLFPLIP